MIKLCKGCNQQQEHHAKGFCYKCYKKNSWKPKIKTCKRCHRDLPLHGKGLCRGCYNTVFRLDYNKNWNYKHRHNISVELYKKITQKCIICDFNKIIDLHHIDKDRTNNSENNLIGLCPNHHKMIHHMAFRDEILELLKSKGVELQTCVQTA